MKRVKYSDLLKCEKIVHFSQRDIEVDYDRPFIPCELSRDARIVFCDNRRKSLLERQCRVSKIPFAKLGHNIKQWKNTFKPFLFFDYLSGNMESLADKIILFLDAYDVILPQDISRLIRVYREKFYNRVVFNATTVSMRSNVTGYARRKIDKFENGLCRGKKFYLNAGAAIGDCSSMLETYRDVVQKMADLYPGHFRDHQYRIADRSRAMAREQPFIRLSIFANKNRVLLDYANELMIRLRPGRDPESAPKPEVSI